MVFPPPLSHSANRHSIDFLNGWIMFVRSINIVMKLIPLPLPFCYTYIRLAFKWQWIFVVVVVCVVVASLCSCYLWTEWSSIVRRYWKNTFTVFIFVWILTHIVLQLFVSFKKAMWWDAQLPMLWVDTFDILTYKSLNARNESISKLTCIIVIRSNLLSTHMRYQFNIQEHKNDSILLLNFKSWVVHIEWASFLA